MFLSLFSPHSLPLEGMKRKIMRNLRTLEEEGMVNSKNDYQEIINAIAKVKTDRVLYRRVLIGSQSPLKAHLHIICHKICRVSNSCVSHMYYGACIVSL